MEKNKFKGKVEEITRNVKSFGFSKGYFIGQLIPFMKDYEEEIIKLYSELKNYKKINNKSRRLLYSQEPDPIIQKFRQRANAWISVQIKIGDYSLLKCIKCNSTDNLIAHHKQYTYPFTLEDIETLCRQCHIREHIRLKENEWKDVYNKEEEVKNE